MSYPNEALTDICKQLLDDWGLSPEEIKALAADISAECEALTENRNEAAWEAWTNRETDDSAYRRNMIDAGRGDLLK